ncbi:hypothetical protein DICVIV_14332, partial [Dictyocaulus viviparus]
YFNSKEIGSHIGGHLPFQFDITSSIIFGSENKLYPPIIIDTHHFSGSPNLRCVACMAASLIFDH